MDLDGFLTRLSTHIRAQLGQRVATVAQAQALLRSAASALPDGALKSHIHKNQQSCVLELMRHLAAPSGKATQKESKRAEAQTVFDTNGWIQLGHALEQDPSKLSWTTALALHELFPEAQATDVLTDHLERSVDKPLEAVHGAIRAGADITVQMRLLLQALQHASGDNDDNDTQEASYTSAEAEAACHKVLSLACVSSSMDSANIRINPPTESLSRASNGEGTTSSYREDLQAAILSFYCDAVASGIADSPEKDHITKAKQTCSFIRLVTGHSFRHVLDCVLQTSPEPSVFWKTLLPALLIDGGRVVPEDHATFIKYALACRMCNRRCFDSTWAHCAKVELLSPDPSLRSFLTEINGSLAERVMGARTGLAVTKHLLTCSDSLADDLLDFLSGGGESPQASSSEDAVLGRDGAPLFFMDTSADPDLAADVHAST